MLRWKKKRPPTVAVIQPTNHFALGLVPYQQVAVGRPKQDRLAATGEYCAEILPLFARSVAIRGIHLLDLALVIRLLDSYQMRPSACLRHQRMCAWPIDVQVVSASCRQLTL